MRRETLEFVLMLLLACLGCSSGSPSGEDASAGDCPSETAPEIDVPAADAIPDPGPVPPVDPALRMRKEGWLSGDLHMHSDYSGGDDPVKGVVALAEYLQSDTFLAFHPEYKGNPVDFIALTDHRMVEQNSDPGFASDKLVLIPGEEFGGPGHAGIWGVKTYVSHDPGGDGSDGADYDAGVAAAHAQGALFSINHPCLNLIPFPWDVRTHDAVEVWNTRWGLQGGAFTKTDLDDWEKANGPASPFFRRVVEITDEGGSGQVLRYYEAQLTLGIHVALVGGSDRHMLFPEGFPSTWVRAATRDVAGILEGIGKRHTFVARTPVSATVEMTVKAGGKEYTMGDAIPIPGAGSEVAVEVRVGRADKGRVRIVRGTRAAGDAALAKTELGVVAFESPVAGIDFTANTTLAVNPGDWLYPVVHEPLVPEGLDPELAAKIPGKMALLATYSEENYSPIIDALIEFIDTGVVLAPENCDPAAWIDTNIQCIPADKTGMASFFFPDWIDRVLNALTEKGKVGEWTMGAVGSAVMFVKHP